MSRLDKLKELEEELHRQMQKANSRTIAAIARQYRETLKEIEEIEGVGGNEDEIESILNERSSNGKAGAVRKDRSKVQTNGRTGCGKDSTSRRNNTRSVASRSAG